MKQQHDERPTLYSSAEAMEYLGMEWSSFRYHVYRRGNLEPDYKIAHNLVFRKETLDAFKSKHFQAEGLTVEEAAQYLGVSSSHIRYHVFYTKLLVPDGKRGKMYVFTKETLEGARSILSQREKATEIEPA